MKALPQRLPDNAIPLTIGGWRVDGLPREMLLRLRKLADRKGSTVADELHEGMAQWLAKREAYIEQISESTPTKSDRAKINAASI